MTQEKTRLKFRVSALDGVTSGGLPEPRWTEKWGVGLFDYEEFHVTDQLLKLPFQEATPKTVCIFSIVDGALAFRLLDEDRRSQVNGVNRRDALVTTGDRIAIGDTLVIEIALAPPKTKSRAASPGPILATQADGEIPKFDPEEGPTLTFAPTGMTMAAKSAVAAHAGPARAVPPLTSDPTDVGTKRPALTEPSALKFEYDVEPVIPPTPVFEEHSRSVEIPEPSLNLLRKPKAAEVAPVPRPSSPGPMPGMVPEQKVELANGSEKKVRTIPPRPASLSSGPMPGMSPEQKVELMNSPHKQREQTDEEKIREMALLTGENIQPLYPDEADLAAKPTFGERILAAISRILRRDDVNPPDEPFPVEEDGPSQPWVPAGMADPGITPTSRMHDLGESNFHSKEKKKSVPIADEETQPNIEPRPWIPEAISAAARIRGRALVFLVAAIGTLMIAVGVFRIQNRVATMEENRKIPAVEPMSEFPPSRGIPIEILQDKVRRMRPAAETNRR